MLKDKQKDRVTIRLNGELESAMADIQRLTHASNATEVVRRALLVYHTLVMQKAAGNEPAILNRVEPDGPAQIPLFL
ncbi:hypothetical protein [Algirhabdus cladophorae]|uniref:hypothetical protein n=1 Tax=Algirhabdus cladophorae TaxID=3377108 RepID=UPI003B84869B